MRRVSISVTPPERRTELTKHNKCLYGVSVGLTSISIEDHIVALSWIANNFKQHGILLGDSLYRFTLQIQKGLTPTQAEISTKEYGNKQMELLNDHLSLLPKVIRCSDILHKQTFTKDLKVVREWFRNNPDFQSSVTNDAIFFISRQTKAGRLATSEGKAIELATSYLLEEIAIYHHLASEGWLVDAYLGKELPTLAKIIQADIPGSYGQLTNRTNISLRLR